MLCIDVSCACILLLQCCVSAGTDCQDEASEKKKKKKERKKNLAKDQSVNQSVSEPVWPSGGKALGW